MFASLRTHSHFSFLRGASSPEEMARRAAELGHTALCLTDWNGVYGAVRLQKACREHGLKPLIGCSLQVAGSPLTILARNADGYESMNVLLTHLHAREEALLEQWDDLASLTSCYLLVADVCVIPKNVAPRNLFLVLDHQHRPGDSRHAHKQVEAAQRRGLGICIAPDVRYAMPDAYRAYDVLTCTRLGITVFDPHPERPVNDAQHLRSEAELRRLLPYPDAFKTTAHIIEECSFDILPGHVTPPSARLPEGAEPDAVLRELCTASLPQKYTADGSHPEELSGARTERRHPEELSGARTERRHPEEQSGAHATRDIATRQLNHELEVIADLGLSDFFLVVKEIVDEATRRGIRHSGRGSAANSIVAYLLGITGVCPIEHRLLFERFLHRGRKGTPDIDVDFDSDRRQEIIDWMERRFGNMQTAMTATLITYRARMAVRDAAKALGWPMEIVHKLSKAIPGFTNKDPHEYRTQLTAIVGDAPLLHTMLDVVQLLLDRPRHLGLHSGGMILSSKPLTHFTPVQRSANGTSVVQFDKDDVEAMGLVKFDVLGLRMLACISEAVELIESTVSPSTANSVIPNEARELLDTMSFDDPAVMDLIRSGNTLGLFQIESQGQMHLLAQHQPECFNDLITEVALFRPGPLQGGMVHPYVRRRRGLEPVTHMHPLLEPILCDTLGIVLFQEQVLEIAHRFAGMPLDEADDFRALVSKNRDPVAMAAMHEKFVKGAMASGADLESAEGVYEKVSHFVGYGFCRSHAAAFARIVYQSAWLKTYYPAAYLAAFMQHRPGFYNLMTIEEEAKRFGVPTLLPDINRSGIRYSLETLADGTVAIRKPLSAIDHVTQDTARLIVWERASGEFRSIEDLWHRVRLPSNVMDSIALSGALDALEGNSRRALWKSGVLNGPRRSAPHDDATRNNVDVLSLLSDVVFSIDDVPELPPIKAQERLAYDYITHGAARVHPMTLYRRTLNELEIRTIESLQAIDGAQNPDHKTQRAVIAGIVILRQSPPTAHGVLFVTLEDETGFVQCVVEPNEREYFKEQLRHAALIVRGVVHARKNWRGLIVRDVRVIRNVIGGYHGHPAMYGGTDKREVVGQEGA